MSKPHPHRLLALAILFIAYQAPEGIGDHLLHSFPLKAALLLAFFPIAWLVARRVLGTGFARAYALDRPGTHWHWLPAMLALALAAKALVVVAGLYMGIYAAASGAGGAAPAIAWMALAPVALTTVFPSLAEDIVARGYWFRQWPQLGSGARFVLFSAGYFVLNHIYRLGNGPTEWLMLFVFGLAYASALARTGTLWAAFGLHWGWNIGAFAAGDVFHVDTLDPASGSVLSIAAHLLMLLVVLALPIGRARHRASAAQSDPAPQ